jgi:hypothetical protein
MKPFRCSSCSSAVYFENLSCLRCGGILGFDSEKLELVTLEPDGEQSYLVVGGSRSSNKYYCANSKYGVCNWIVDAHESLGLCRACNLNRMIPNLDRKGAQEAWASIERAKKRLMYSLLRFGLPLNGGLSGKPPMTFDFMADAVTGHFDGVITIDIDEADEVERTRQRQQLAEPYRTVLGHLRHESGHYYWMLLIDGSNLIDEFRQLFGDDRENYADAIRRHHDQGPMLNWQSEFVSAYASSHPWEDWAETWAHYLHMVDVLETAQAYGSELRSANSSFGVIWPSETLDAYRDIRFDVLMEHWIPMTLVMNGLNRSMGHDDFYPFAIPQRAVEKLEFIHNTIRRSGPS